MSRSYSISTVLARGFPLILIGTECKKGIESSITVSVCDIARRSVRIAVVSSILTVKDLSFTVSVVVVIGSSDMYDTFCSMNRTSPWISVLAAVVFTLNSVFVISRDLRRGEVCLSKLTDWLSISLEKADNF